MIVIGVQDRGRHGKLHRDTPEMEAVTLGSLIKLYIKQLPLTELRIEDGSERIVWEGNSTLFPWPRLGWQRSHHIHAKTRPTAGRGRVEISHHKN